MGKNQVKSKRERGENMARDIDRLTEEFRLNYDRFVHACDAAEAEGRWNTEELGEMEGTCFNAILGVLLHLIITDGNVAARETEVLNRAFGFDYTVESLLELYYSVGTEIEKNCLDNAKECLALLKGIDGDLAAEFVGLLNLICSIAAESDEGASEAELDAIRSLNESL